MAHGCDPPRADGGRGVGVRAWLGQAKAKPPKALSEGCAVVPLPVDPMRLVLFRQEARHLGRGGGSCRPFLGSPAAASENGVVWPARPEVARSQARDEGRAKELTSLEQVRRAAARIPAAVCFAQIPPAPTVVGRARFTSSLGARE